MQLGLRQVVAAAAVQARQRALLRRRAEAVARQAVDRHREALGEVEHDVAAGHAPPPHRLVDDDGQRRVGARVARSRVRDAVLHHRRRPPAAVPRHGVEVRHVGDEDVVEAGVVQHRVLAAHGVLRGRVVLEVHGGEVAPDPAAGPPFDEVDLVRPLEDDGVDLGVAQRLGRELLGGVGPSQVRARPRPSGPRSGRTGRRYSCSPETREVVYEPWTCHTRTFIAPLPPGRPHGAAAGVASRRGCAPRRRPAGR